MDNNSFSNSSQENPIIEAQGINPNPPRPNSSQGQHRSLIYVIFVVIILGAVAGLMGTYLINKPEEPEECLDCHDPGPTSTSSEVDYAFLQLESAQGNIIYSPLSIRNGLELLRAGASGDTKTEIDNVLGSAALSKYENIPDKLSLANAVFIRESFKDYVLPTYITEVQDELGSEVFYDPFENSVSMDNWVNQKTFGLIDKVGIQPSPDLRMVLANALAIQMDWKHQFDDNDTYGRDFYKSDGSTINATTMQSETSAEDVFYAVDNSATVVSMPLDSGSEEVNLEFIAIMPSDNLSNYINNIDQTKIDKLTKLLTPASEPEDGVIINIPKFKFEYELNFAEDLAALGIKSAFNESLADFSKMASKPLYVGDAIHKANIDFSEEGIKAAAITVFAMNEATAIDPYEPKPVIININHPFLFIIRDANSGTIWFTGAVYEPNLWEDDTDDYKMHF